MYSEEGPPCYPLAAADRCGPPGVAVIFWTRRYHHACDRDTAHTAHTAAAAAGPVLIAGGGIAGPALAIALRRAGLDAVVYEASPAPRDAAGAFLNLAPNGLDALRALGLGHLAELGFRNDRLVFHTETGRVLAEAPVGGVTVMRGALSRGLREAALAAGVRVEFGQALESVAARDGGVVARFAGGGTAAGRALVGADGVHSRTRASVLPEAPKPAYTGILNLGGVVRTDLPPTGRAMHMIFGRRGFFGYAVRPSGDTYWFSNVAQPEEPPRGSLEAVDAAAYRQRLLALHRDDPPEVTRILQAVGGDLGAYAVYDVPALPRWHRGAVGLIGDSAHAVGPHVGQGASLALEDAFVLAKCLRDLPEGGGARRVRAAAPRAGRARAEAVPAHRRAEGARGVARPHAPRPAPAGVPAQGRRGHRVDVRLPLRVGGAHHRLSGDRLPERRVPEPACPSTSEAGAHAPASAPAPAGGAHQEAAMRSLIVTNIVSLDGYYEGPGGEVMVLPMDHRFDAYNVERLREADTLLLGRTSYELFRGFWPAQADAPDAPPAHRELSRLENAIDKVVVSDRLTPDQTDPWRATTRIVRRAEAQGQIADLKRRPGRDILVFGSRTLWNGLLAAGLVDEPAPDRRAGRPRRRDADLRHRAGRPAPAARHPHVRRLGQRAPPVRHGRGSVNRPGRSSPPRGRSRAAAATTAAGRRPALGPRAPPRRGRPRHGGQRPGQCAASPRPATPGPPAPFEAGQAGRETLDMSASADDRPRHRTPKERTHLT